MRDKTVAAAALDKQHKLLKYMVGTKGHTRVGDTDICTCTCGEYLVTNSANQFYDFMDDHEECQ